MLQKYYEPVHANTQTLDMPKSMAPGTDVYTSTDFGEEDEYEDDYRQN
jgi:hypothetical protein